MVQKFTKRVLGEGKFLRLCAEDRWEFVERMNSNAVVAILAITDDRKIVLVDQARHSLGKRVIELPAGLVGDEVHFRGESLETAARRELLEESGYTAEKFILFSATQPSSIIDWAIYSFAAKGCKKILDPAPDAGEKITLHYLTLDEFIELARDPKFRDLEVSLNIFRAIGTKDGYEALRRLFAPE